LPIFVDFEIAFHPNEFLKIAPGTQWCKYRGRFLILEKGGENLSGVALVKPEPLPYIPARGRSLQKQMIPTPTPRE
jgi:hypothetical protein